MFCLPLYVEHNRYSINDSEWLRKRGSRGEPRAVLCSDRDALSAVSPSASDNPKRNVLKMWFRLSLLEGPAKPSLNEAQRVECYDG